MIFLHLQVSDQRRPYEKFSRVKNKTVKITEINPIEDFSFTQCTSRKSFILQFFLFQYEVVFNEIKQSIANKYWILC